MSTLWSKGTQATDLVEDFTVGNDRILDMRLAKYDVQGSMAHIKTSERRSIQDVHVTTRYS